MNSSFISTTEGVHIWHNDCLWGVDYNIGFRSPLYHRCQKTRSNILTISLWLVTRTPLSLFDQGCSYLAQLLLMGCKIQKLVSEYDQDIPYYKPQTTPWHREEEPLSHHETPGRQIKQSNQLSLLHQDDCNTRMDI